MTEAEAYRIGEAISTLDPELWPPILAALQAHYPEWQWTHGFEESTEGRWASHWIDVTATQSAPKAAAQPHDRDSSAPSSHQ